VKEKEHKEFSLKELDDALTNLMPEWKPEKPEEDERKNERELDRARAYINVRSKIRDYRKRDSDGEKYRKLHYPKPERPTKTKFRYIGDRSPRVGKYYLVKSGRHRYEGYLDHVARVRGGAVLGWIYSANGEQVGSAPITKHALWYELEGE